MLVDNVLHQSGKQLRDIAGIAYGAGPGAFTGVRLACGMAQGLGLGLGVPLIPVSTLESLLPLVDVPRLVVVQDARMNQLYLAAYERQGHQWQERLPPTLCAPDHLPDLPAASWWAAGSGTALCGQQLSTRWGSHIQGIIPGLAPHAAQIATLAYPRWLAGTGVAAAMAQPVYLRQHVALTLAERGL